MSILILVFAVVILFQCRKHFFLLKEREYVVMTNRIHEVMETPL